MTGSYVDSTPGPPQNLNLPTNSVSATATLLYPIRRARVGNLSVRGTFSYFNGQTDFEGVELSEDRIRAVRAGLAWDAIDAWRGVNLADLELSQGLKGLGASPYGNPLASRAGGRPDFTKVTLYAARLQSLAPRWSVLAAVNTQYAFNELLSPEEFAYGGEQFGRAYDFGRAGRRSGVGFKIDLRYTERTTWPIAREIMPYVFYGIGVVWQRNPQPGEDARSSAANAGAGVRVTGERGFSGYLEVAKPLTRCHRRGEQATRGCSSRSSSPFEAKRSVPRAVLSSPATSGSAARGPRPAARLVRHIQIAEHFSAVARHRLRRQRAERREDVQGDAEIGGRIAGPIEQLGQELRVAVGEEDELRGRPHARRRVIAEEVVEEPLGSPGGGSPRGGCASRPREPRVTATAGLRRSPSAGEERDRRARRASAPAPSRSSTPARSRRRRVAWPRQKYARS